jgi:hypothetical protein
MAYTGSPLHEHFDGECSSGRGDVVGAAGWRVDAGRWPAAPGLHRKPPPLPPPPREDVTRDSHSLHWRHCRVSNAANELRKTLLVRLRNFELTVVASH